MAASWGPRGQEKNPSGKRSENAVRKDGNNDEKVACSDDECSDGLLPLGHGRDGADLLPPRGGVGEGDADADRQEPGRAGAPLPGGCSVAGRAGPAWSGCAGSP